ncbi:SGNH/GDSL hydrolase family protein [Sphingobacterium sp. SRCM116780]|uniref:SGNH/GDSL hydrolase family protein n=1 Tax=Sphingobacterium sp. SRCM116780 TaxID=2907623 RepID=UPI001F44737F|nr:SGNH/GDSL hydrolase family protein [Sphingobacterium sp. SRCM116780]UIR54964.1 SGNH/GDSL hydrolase family protein [Sphingobacterium sp. SRCM116780]
MKTNRRSFITKSIIGAGLLTNANLFSSQAETITSTKKSKKISINNNDIILFQGDSITDNGRDRNNNNANDSGALGTGYAHLAAAMLLEEYADKNIKIYNRGISGNRVPDLQNRWQQDTIDLKPTILSILIGVNDFWRTKDSGAINTPEQFKKQYQVLLQKTLDQLPQVKLIIGEPFGVKNVKHVTDSWFPDFPGYQQVCIEIAKEFNAAIIPYQSIFDDAQKRASGSYWTTDGIHTSLAGASLMSESWLDVIK